MIKSGQKRRNSIRRIAKFLRTYTEEHRARTRNRKHPAPITKKIELTERKLTRYKTNKTNVYLRGARWCIEHNERKQQETLIANTK